MASSEIIYDPDYGQSGVMRLYDPDYVQPENGPDYGCPGKKWPILWMDMKLSEIVQNAYELNVKPTIVDNQVVLLKFGSSQFVSFVV